MRTHIKLYLDFHGLHGEFIPCKVCDAEANDIHHIEPKGMGGTAGKDHIGNLIALCRSCHEKAHKSELKKDYLYYLLGV